MINELKDPRMTFGAAVTEVAATNNNVIVLSADSSSGSGMGEFKKRYPDRHFEFGIMEQGVTGFASGLATTGKIPVFAIYDGVFGVIAVNLGRKLFQIGGKPVRLAVNGNQHQKLWQVCLFLVERQLFWFSQL